MKNFSNILFSFLFCFVINKSYSNDCCGKFYDCCCNCLHSDDIKINNPTYGNKIYKKSKKEPSIIPEVNEDDVSENESVGVSQDYFEKVLDNFNNIKVIREDFFKEQNIYEIEKNGTEKNDGVLGKGVFGKVYKIKSKNNKIYALKQTIPQKGKLQSVQNEIQILIWLKDEQNILKIVDVYRQDNISGISLRGQYYEVSEDTCFYIITEYCENIDLGYFIEEKNIANKEKLKDKIAYQIINTVHTCYKKRIAHRDLKPENILLDKNYNVKLGDFGLSDIFEYEEKNSSSCGSQRYLCYEITQRIERDPFKADLYALGVVLYELYTELSYSKDECKPGTTQYKDNFYTNENVKRKLEKNLKRQKYKNLKILLIGLLQQFEEERWGWENIFDSQFYKELEKKYKGK